MLKKNKEDKKQEINEEELKNEVSSERNIKDIISMYHSYKAAKESTIKKWNRIKAFYDGDFWEKFKEKIKDYTLIPDTNYVEYVVTAYINSIYSGIYIPEIIAGDLSMDETAQKLSAYIHSEFMKRNIKQDFVSWGENTLLYNMQPVKVFLKNKNKKKDIEFETISPFGIFFDPSVADYSKGEAIFIVKETNIYTLMKDPRYKQKITNFLNTTDDKNLQVEATNIGDQQPDYERFTTTGNKTVSVLEYYIRTKNGIDNGFIMNEALILHEKQNIIPDRFPIEVLYHRKPNGNPYGTPLIYKILNSYITLNLLDSMDATQPYLAQNRPKFFDLKSRINPRSFIDYGNTPGATFPLFGEPGKGVHYQDIQVIPETFQIKQRLEMGIFNVTGVDPAYKGRQTNSITTTGGVEAQQARVIMLTDNAPLVALETFVEKLSKLYLETAKEHIEEIQVRENNFIKKMAKMSLKEVDFQDFTFILESKPYLPMTKQTRFETLKQLYEMQGQYNFQIKLIQEEDLLDELPVDPIRKSKLMQRISSEKQSNAALKKRETLLTFASLFQQMQSAGLGDEEAANEALSIMDQEENARMQDPTLGVNRGASMPQGGAPKF
jgi:hypothetical protein